MCLCGIEGAARFRRGAFWAHDIYVFDVDDTLLYTFQNGFRKLNAAAELCGLAPLSFSQYKQDYGVFPFLECLRRWFPSGDAVRLSQCYACMWQRIPYQAVCDFSALQRVLHRHGKRTALLTNGARNEKLYRKLEVCRVDWEGLEGLWCAQDLPAQKPSPLAITPIQQRFPGKRLLYIGDAASDRQMACSAGIGFLQVCSGKEPPLPDTDHISSLATLLQELEREGKP